MNRKIKFVRIIHQLISEPTHRLATPRINGIFINRQSGVGYNQIFVNTNHIAVSVANRASSVRIIKTEQMNVWFEKIYAVFGKMITEIVLFSGFVILNHAIAFAFIKSNLYRICQTIVKIFVMT